MNKQVTSTKYKELHIDIPLSLRFRNNIMPHLQLQTILNIVRKKEQLQTIERASIKNLTLLLTHGKV